MVVDTFGNMTTNIHDSKWWLPWLLGQLSPSEQFSAVQHVEMITILFCCNLLRLSPHFTNIIG